MAQGKTPAEVYNAFQDRKDIQTGIESAISANPGLSNLFKDISRYIISVRSKPANGGEPAPKKRKLDEEAGDSQAASSSWANPALPPAFEQPNVSFSVPQRKKLTLQFVDPTGTKKSQGGLRAVNPATGAVEFGLSWEDVDQIFCLSIPEKQKRQHNFVVIPKGGDGVTPLPEGTEPVDPIVWSCDETKENGSDSLAEPRQTAALITEKLKALGKKVIFAEEKEFASAISQSHRKAEKAFHVKAHRGSKDGYLWFLSTGILWGFKKPLAYLSFQSITSISYTAVLQRTFNLNVTTEHQEIEFAMIDQADFPGIDDYVKRHGLNDASMAAERRAKKFNVNPPAKSAQAEDGTNGAAADGDDEESELQKAERQLEDEEDEDEEDYDPGSEGESEGEGSSSEEEEEYGEEGGEDDEEEVDEDEVKDLQSHTEMEVEDEDQLASF